MHIRPALPADIPGILALQEKHLFANLDETARAADGFVTTPFTVAQIETLIAANGAYIADVEGQIVGYVFGGAWQFYAQWPIFEYMVSRFSGFEFQGQRLTLDNSFQYGPICVDHAHRGSGVFEQLFQALNAGLRHRYPLGGTFINKANTRSFQAHRSKLRLEVVDEFDYNGRSYYTLAYFT